MTGDWPEPRFVVRRRVGVTTKSNGGEVPYTYFAIVDRVSLCREVERVRRLKHRPMHRAAALAADRAEQMEAEWLAEDAANEAAERVEVAA